MVLKKRIMSIFLCLLTGILGNVIQLSAQTYDRVWNGNNPYYQPLVTTNYYGSGDIDLDGSLTATDLTLLNNMAIDLLPDSTRGDTDGDGVISMNDYARLYYAINNGQTLPGQWNKLDAAGRENWVTKCFAIDKTNQYTYQMGFVCTNFSEQTYYNFSAYKCDILEDYYENLALNFNIPLYIVDVTFPDGVGHGINAVLIGENPENFYDWLFMEPQTDTTINIGDWDMPYGAIVSIKIVYPQSLTMYNQHSQPKITFNIDANGVPTYNATLSDPNLIRTRPAPPTLTPNTVTHIWNPRIIGEGNGLLLYNKGREDMSGVSDIHVTDLPFNASNVSTPLVGDPVYGSRLLDSAKGPDGTVHLLWKGKAKEAIDDGYGNIIDCEVPTLYYQTFNPVTKTIGTRIRLGSGVRHFSQSGRIVVTSDNKIHAFWLDISHQGEATMVRGIYHSWTTFDGTPEHTVWQQPEKLSVYIHDADFFPVNTEWLNYESRLNYYFDVAVTSYNSIILAWAERDRVNIYTGNMLLRVQEYNNGWLQATVLDTDNVYGLSMAADSNHNVHLVYWGSSVLSQSNYLGNIYHRIYNGSTWSTRTTVDSNNNAEFVNIEAGQNGMIFLVWERDKGNSVVSAWSTYENSVWGSIAELPVRTGAKAWYPSVYSLTDGSPVTCWSSLSNDLATIEVFQPVSTPVPTPTATPISTPTSVPTATPISTPTSVPTATPTSVPTATPISTPTSVPTATPTSVPTSTPVSTPTSAPTATPISTPTSVPTATPTSTPTPTPTGCTCAAGCSATVVITVPFQKDGIGELCYEATSLGSYVNSWNTDVVNLNGTNITNLYVSSSAYPPPINGKYYVYYKASSVYGHLETK